jgi:drug/metabolite transporter (DMT)-like permease
MPGGISARRRAIGLVFVATALWSLAGFFTRLLDHLDAYTILGGRALFGAAFAFVVALAEWRRGVLGAGFGLAGWAPLIAALSAIAMSAYIVALKQTSVADVMVIYATLPFVAAAFSLVVNNERPSPRTLVAAGFALLGVAIMVGGATGAGRLTGELMALAMTVAFALMIVIQRRYPGMSMTSINVVGALLAGAVGFGLSPRPPLSAFDIAMLAAFGLASICLAFTLFMAGARHIPAAEAGLISMFDVALGPLWVFLAFGERPAPSALAGGALVFGALIWRLAPDLGRVRRASPS